MTKISQDEIKKIARISCIAIYPDEIQPLQEKVEEVITYAERVMKAAQIIQEPSNTNINVFREDLVIRSEYEQILAQAPERAGNYFVVPKIL